MSFAYCINVARQNGQLQFNTKAPLYSHLFRVEIEPGYSERAREALKELRERFPAPDFRINVTRSQPHVSESIMEIE